MATLTIAELSKHTESFIEGDDVIFLLGGKRLEVEDIYKTSSINSISRNLIINLVERGPA